MSNVATISIDLGPRALTVTPERPFVMSPDAVRAIRAYVEEVRAVWDAVPDFRIPPQLRGMVDASQRWDSDTYPRIRDMADSLATYGSTTAPRRYREIAELLPELRSSPEGGAGRDFAAILQDLIDVCRGAAEDSRVVLESISGFSESMSKAEDYIRAELHARGGRVIEDWQGLLWKAVEKNHGDPRAALAATQTIWGVWQSLYTDLLGVQETTAGMLSARLPFLVHVRIDLAISQWRDLGECAWAFRASIES